MMMVFDSACQNAVSDTIAWKLANPTNWFSGMGMNGK